MTFSNSSSCDCKKWKVKVGLQTRNFILCFCSENYSHQWLWKDVLFSSCLVASMQLLLNVYVWRSVTQSRSSATQSRRQPVFSPSSTQMQPLNIWSTWTFVLWRIKVSPLPSLADVKCIVRWLLFYRVNLTEGVLALCILTINEMANIVEYKILFNPLFYSNLNITI